MNTKHQSRSFFSLSFCAVVLSLTGAAACVDTQDGDVDDAEMVDGADDSKSDQADIVLTPVDFSPPKHADGLHVGVIKTKAAWKGAFGIDPPSSINFQKQWVAYYTAGERNSGGFQANISHVRLSDAGTVLKIATRLDRPGNGCTVVPVLSTPYAIVKFDKPRPAPTTNRYTTESRTVSCGIECGLGSIKAEAAYTASSNGMECSAPVEHCVTDDLDACPVFTSLPPSFCPGGTVEIDPRYVSSSDGMECEIPSAHCLTNDSHACPQFSPVPPGFCPNGMVQTGHRFTASADGMECRLPTVHCVTDVAAACP